MDALARLDIRIASVVLSRDGDGIAGGPGRSAGDFDGQPQRRIEEEEVVLLQTTHAHPANFGVRDTQVEIVVEHDVDGLGPGIAANEDLVVARPRVRDSRMPLTMVATPASRRVRSSRNSTHKLLRERCAGRRLIPVIGRGPPRGERVPRQSFCR